MNEFGRKPMRRRSAIAGVACGFAAFLTAFAAGATPAPVKTVSEWAGESRVVSAESGSPFPGRWRNDLAPYLPEIMDCLSPSHPCRDVTFKKSHQVAGSEAGVNLFGLVVDHEPGPMLIVLPTLDEASKYNRTKLQPTIDVTPALKRKVRDEKSRSSAGSTAAYKRFAGGFCQVTGANTSSGLQMISARYLIAEEISEWPDDAGKRGDPLAMAEARTTAWSDRCKRFYVSTPGIKGMCRISEKFEASDQRRLYVRCPYCGVWQILKFDNLKWDSETAPHGAYFECAAHGCVIEHHHKGAMVAGGKWIKTYPGEGKPGDTIEDKDIETYRARDSAGREPGFAIWQAYSPFVSWDDTAAKWLDAKNDPHKEKVFSQQVLGEDFEESGEAPDHEKLFLRREPYKAARMPVGALVLTGMADVQGGNAARLEWGVYAWGIGMTGWHVDGGVIPGDPTGDAVWRELAAVTERKYEDWQGNLWPIEAFGVDTGYLSHEAYNFCRRRQRTFAMDGRGGPLLPFIGTPKKVDVNWRGKTIKGGVLLWPTGTWPLKSAVYGGLRKTIAGPDASGLWPLGCLHFSDACDPEFFKQITAEFLVETEKNGRTVRAWRKAQGQANEQLDIVVGARALAAHLGLDRLTADQWQRLAAERGAPPDVAQRDLAELWNARPGEQPVETAAAPPSGGASDSGPRVRRTVTRGDGGAMVRGTRTRH